MNYSTTSPRATDGASATPSDLVAAARRLFAARGFDGASVRAITSEANANLGAVTYHFGSKAALYEAVLEATLVPFAERVEAAAATPGTALDRIVEVVKAYFEHLGEHQDMPRLLLQEIAAGKHPPRVVVENISRVKGTLERLCSEGVDDGTVRQGHPTLTALSIVSQPVYLSLIAPLIRTIGGIDFADPETRARTVEHVTDFVRRGLEPRREATA
jgi:AcrR family transcriptional regulator